MNAQMDKRTYFGNIGLAKIEEMNPEP